MNSKSIMRVVVAAFAAAAVMLQCASAQTRYVVGDGIGWDIPPNGAAAYTSWTSGKQFLVGDILIFNFATNQHDVQQVQQDSFDACTSTNPIGNSITNGPANITLTTAGDHYYICTFGRHCQAGQKIAINVSGTSLPPSTTTTPPQSAPSPTSNTSPDAACPPPQSSDPPAAGPPVSTTPDRAGNSPPDSSSPAVFASFIVISFGIAMAFFL